MERILIFGNGQIGNFYKKFFDSKSIDSVITPSDITKKKEIEKAITSYKPTVAINTAAMTNLEECALKQLQTVEVNTLGANNVAEACDKHRVYFIHFSSGCIFQSKDESDAKKEDDKPNPAAFYSWSKVWSENLIQWNKSSNFKYIILRPRQPISSQISYKNMLIKLLTFCKFIDTPNTGTVIEDLMDWTLEIINKKPVGILHVANEGWSTPYEIALLLKKYVLPSLEVNKISKEELDKITPNKRVDTILNVDKLKSLGVKLIPYKERLEDIVKQLAENIKKADKQFLKKQLDLTLAQSKARTVVNKAWKNLLK